MIEKLRLSRVWWWLTTFSIGLIGVNTFFYAAFTMHGGLGSSRVAVALAGFWTIDHALDRTVDTEQED